jgi:hypothetical protein
MIGITSFDLYSGVQSTKLDRILSDAEVSLFYLNKIQLLRL